MPNRRSIWRLREGYLMSKGNPMEDPFRGHRPGRGRRVLPSDRIEFEPVDVTDIRDRFEMDQTEFARMLGISVETLRNWERGRRRPLGPSRAILRLAAAHPDVVANVLRNARVDWSPEEEAGWESLEVVLKRKRAQDARLKAERAVAEAREAEEASAAEDGPEGE